MEWVPKLVFLVFWFFLAVVTALLLIGLKTLVIYLMEASIKEEFYAKAPKVDTNLCDKGHLYPSDLALRLEDIPGLEADVPLCPICFDNNMRNAEELLKRERTRTAAKEQTSIDKSSRPSTGN